MKVWFQNRRTKQKRVRQEDIERRQRYASVNGDCQLAEHDINTDDYDSDLDIDVNASSRSSTPNSLEISSSGTGLDFNDTSVSNNI